MPGALGSVVVAVPAAGLVGLWPATESSYGTAQHGSQLVEAQQEQHLAEVLSEEETHAEETHAEFPCSWPNRSISICSLSVLAAAHTGTGTWKLSLGALVPYIHRLTA